MASETELSERPLVRWTLSSTGIGQSVYMLLAAPRVFPLGFSPALTRRNDGHPSIAFYTWGHPCGSRPGWQRWWWWWSVCWLMGCTLHSLDLWGRKQSECGKHCLRLAKIFTVKKYRGLYATVQCDPVETCKEPLAPRQKDAVLLIIYKDLAFSM